jgi:hypothetical protein
MVMDNARRRIAWPAVVSSKGVVEANESLARIFLLQRNVHIIDVIVCEAPKNVHTFFDEAQRAMKMQSRLHRSLVIGRIVEEECIIAKNASSKNPVAFNTSPLHEGTEYPAFPISYSMYPCQPNDDPKSLRRLTLTFSI